MTIATIIEELDAEIARLQQVKALLSNGRKRAAANLATAAARGLSKVRKKRVLSPEARQRIAEAQRKRWAAQKRANK